MKKIFLLAGLALSLGASFRSDAQVRINVNIGAPMPVMQQSWYGSDADYYYMPDQGVYYNVNRRMYVWPGGGGWLCGPALPASYGACTWGNSRYYSFRGRSPFMRHDYYRGRYGSGGRSGAYAYRGYNGRGNGRWDDNRQGNRWNEGRRGGGRWNDDRGGRGFENGGGRGGNPQYGNGGGRGGNQNYGNNNNGGAGGGYNGNNNGGGNGGGGRGGWDRR